MTSKRVWLTIHDSDPPEDGEVPVYEAASDTYIGAAYAAAVHSHAVHDESLTDGAGNFIFAGGDIITVVGVANS